jgi:hypothetical protein
MGLGSVEAGHRFVDICTMTPSISACTLSTPLYQVSVMDFDRHNIFLLEVFQPVKQHTMSNQAVSGFDDDCTFVPARIVVKIERAYTTVDLVFRDIRLDFGHYGTDGTSSDDGFFLWYQDGGLEPHDESDDFDSGALAVLFALTVFEVRRD